ncbi:MAG: MetQ/NlpA family ABC transporter substrate-binding protein [Mesotoga sp.]|jgi:D-methionine transport system substrate-binding protein|uniref:MetQ/NlpA family ABC transporter substrate-binding protein n=1 Tax=unclassified Mesotoga TaxID=1184398 RepID=UPI000EF1E07D|nr:MULTISPECIES: MetQ/NlpA family ABC transporter substrate-binding protein [unclassified Mesotoga]MDI9369151.1 MetQ/NlpA family ABC transporter substrate-binding protein [Thermotogota bacterium]NLT45473.1 ABC transporter substrate-binding protein [Thermotogaceae bacterium]MDD2333473.1 MetQ/NlpA family ABC transporter substrate-binding protein [Mesotoga sp.]MDD3681410.1 MetQ/NlpA family ABC transporter substrate-binding protein [Mesotoga sp.]MDD4207957.1 MetQ/NlpA family ABC transporter substr
MKKFLVLIVLLGVVFAFGTTKIRIGATPVPHAEILEVIKADLAELGYELEIIVFNDYVLPNIALSTGELDANYFQHVPYLESFTSQRGIKGLVSAKAIHVEPMGFFLKKPLSELAPGDKIAVPNDPTNEGRALILLHNNGLIVLKDPSKLESTVLDIKENPKQLTFVEIEAGFIPRVYTDDKTVAGAVINTNYALTINLNAVKDSEFIEGAESPYANIITIRETDKDAAWLEALISVLTSEKVRDFINEKYDGAVVPVF